MTVRGNTLIDWKMAGAMLAQQGDIEQSAFLKAFLKECRSWGTSLQVEQQFAFVNGMLSDEDKEALKMLSYTD